MDLNRLMRLSGAVEDLVEDGRITAESLDDRAHEDGIPLEHLYVATRIGEVDFLERHGPVPAVRSDWRAIRCGRRGPGPTSR